jgi:hypothetical protein
MRTADSLGATGGSHGDGWCRTAWNFVDRLSTRTSTRRAAANAADTASGIYGSEGHPSPLTAALTAARSPAETFNASSAVVSLDSPQSQLEHHFSVAHHCGFWAAG